MNSKLVYAKAIIGALTSGIVALAGALADGNGVSAVEWCTIALAFLGVGGGVAATRNAARPGDNTLRTSQVGAPGSKASPDAP